ncbi:cysteine hydrolase family protein [Streptomyces sp. NPDC056653]|uniref:cysteine hydrolase family protein n=1 Tax=Streptomyces sp. NPDC056653 TaxID=3345894 RepID=UPI003678CF6A
MSRASDAARSDLSAASSSHNTCDRTIPRAISCRSTVDRVLIDLQQWIVDMQWEPVTGGVVADACVALRDRFAHAGSPAVILVRYVRADGADGGVDAAPNRLVPGLEPHAGDRLVTKNGLDAFEGTGLDDHLRGSGVTKLVLAGLSTAHGVAATASTTKARGYEVAVAADATASRCQAEHHTALEQLAALGVRIGRVEELLPERVTGS